MVAGGPATSKASPFRNLFRDSYVGGLYKCSLIVHPSLFRHRQDLWQAIPFFSQRIDAFVTVTVIHHAGKRRTELLSPALLHRIARLRSLQANLSTQLTATIFTIRFRNCHLCRYLPYLRLVGPFPLISLDRHISDMGSTCPVRKFSGSWTNQAIRLCTPGTIIYLITQIASQLVNFQTVSIYFTLIS